MRLSHDQKVGILLSVLSFAACLAVIEVSIAYQLCVLFPTILGVALLLLSFWGLAMAVTSPDSDESVAFNMRRLIAASRGAAVRSERELQEEEEMKTAIDLDDQERIDKL